MSFIVSQLGAREHYAVARALHQSGQLAGLYTDFWAGAATRTLARACGFAPLRSLAGRYHQELGESRKQNSEGRGQRAEAGSQKSVVSGQWSVVTRRPIVHSWNCRALGWEARLRLKRDHGTTDHETTGRYEGYIEVGRRFAVCVREALKRRRDLSPDTIFFGYDTGALETLEFLRERGIRCVVDQMDPNRIEVNLVREEERRWAGWQDGVTQVPEEYFCRREKEWALADRVVVNSEFCRQALVQQGVPEGKLVVVPLSFEPEVRSQTSDLRPLSSDPLKVLFLGQVILRKGIQYLIEAARQLASENVRFDIVGPVGISRDAVASAPPNMTFHGRVTRGQSGEWYRRSDVFVLPTISDGFAITQLEAMGHGLPVITTPNCGDVVRQEVDGLLVSVRDAGASARAIARFAADRNWLAECSRNARERVRDFSLGKLSEDLLRIARDEG